MKRSAATIAIATKAGRCEVLYTRRACIVRFYELARGMKLVDTQVREFAAYPQWRGVYSTLKGFITANVFEATF